MYTKNKILTLIGTGIVVYLLFRFLFWLMVPVVIVWGIGRLLQPLVCFLEKVCHFPAFLSVTVPVTLCFVGIGGGLYYFVFSLGEQCIRLMKRLPIYINWLEEKTNVICQWCDDTFFMKQGTALSYAQKQVGQWCMNLGNRGVSALTCYGWNLMQQIFAWVGVAGIVFILTCLYLKNTEEIKKNCREQEWFQELSEILKPLTQVGFAYIRAQGIIIAIVATVCAFGFYLTGSSYSLLFGILVAVVDAFPVLGSGLILVPSAVFAACQHNMTHMVIYFVVLLICQLVRQFLEPKLIGDKIGFHPFWVLLSVYFGLQLFGVIGVFTGPMALVLWQSLLHNLHNLHNFHPEQRP